VSVELKGGIDQVRRFVSELKLWPLAESLGGVKSLLCHPATMTHAAVEPAERQRVGIGDGLIRLSVGIEDARDLIEDLDRSLKISADARRAVPATESQSARRTRAALPLWTSRSRGRCGT
jgi:cystathionine beta-lyase/cystathionine gamma-synthase